jgi:hypothetical protein
VNYHLYVKNNLVVDTRGKEFLKMENQGENGYDINLPSGEQVNTGANDMGNQQISEPVGTNNQTNVNPEPPKVEKNVDVQSVIAGLSLDELLRGNKHLKSDFDKKMASAQQKAIANKAAKDERLRNAALTDEQRLAGITDIEELRSATASLLKEKEQRVEREREQLQLRGYVSNRLSERGLADNLISLFDFVDDTQDGIDLKLNALEQYKATMQAEYEKKLADQEAIWRRTNPPQTGGNVKLDPYKARAEKYVKRR